MYFKSNHYILKLTTHFLPTFKMRENNSNLTIDQTFTAAGEKANKQKQKQKKTKKNKGIYLFISTYWKLWS